MLKKGLGVASVIYSKKLGNFLYDKKRDVCVIIVKLRDINVIYSKIQVVNS